MMRIFTTILLLACSLCFATDGSQEPPLKYTVEINGQGHELILDKAIKVNGNYTDPTIVIRASKVREFTYGAVVFQYPAFFTWESKIESLNEKSWTLSGNDFKIMYITTSEAITLEDFVLQMCEQFGKKNTKVSNAKRKLGSGSFQGKNLRVAVGGVLINLEVYALPTKSGSRLLVFQDSLPDEKNISNEGQQALTMFTESFKDTMRAN